MFGASLLYNLMLAQKAGITELIDLYREGLQGWAELVEQRRGELTQWHDALPDFWRIATSGGAVIPAGARRFVESWLDCALAPGNTGRIADVEPARQLIHERERSLKRNLARLDNQRALELWTGAAGAYAHNYRWPAAQRIVRDILAGPGAGGQLCWRLMIAAPCWRRCARRSAIGWIGPSARPIRWTCRRCSWRRWPSRCSAGKMRQADQEPIHWRSWKRCAAMRDRIRIFCQAGQIAIPRPNQLLLNYLEHSVYEVRAPDRRGVFHPKVWVLRFAPQEDGRPISYRVLCLSRNLTFDRSWDTALVLDGEVTERSYGYGDNRPLADFIAALPDLATRSVPAQVGQDVEVVQSELRKVSFALPEGFEKVTFHPLGHRGRHSWPFAEAADRRLVISPFLAAGVLEKLSATGRDHVLVSRLEALEAIEPATLARFTIGLYA